jgi:hypothetical protein
MYEWTEDQQTEYNALMEQLADEEFLLRQEQEDVERRRKEIRARVIQVADILGGKNIRVVMPLITGFTWDRRVQTRGGQVDENKLRELIGDEVYNDLVERVTMLDPLKLELARKEGRVTEEQLSKAMTEVKYVNALQLVERK